MVQGELGKNPFVRSFDLSMARKHAHTVWQPRAHQTDALQKLKAWFGRPGPSSEGHGGLLVLPTGGGKTFTAVRFLCEWPLSQGYKVLWLAHTHHLLEQAFETFGPGSPSPDRSIEVSKIREPRDTLRMRVVSGMPGHAKPPSMSAEDDVIIGSLQTFANAHRDDHASLNGFLRSAGQKLFVVFDEAHHAPAPTYARFVDALREKSPGLCVLGLTATPVYQNKLRQGWLKKLFPQGIVYQTTANTLIAAGVLARPLIKEEPTRIKAEFDERAFDRWKSTYADLPDDIVDNLARNTQRNDLIVKTYVDNRKEFGKTLIFADRWFQCDYLRTGLLKHGVRADVVYSHVDAKPGTVAERNRRTADENTKVIRAFKKGDLDVLINVKMLTEGTDVPSIQTVFLTRQTTSKVLLTQMIGRALRGPEFKGTETANVVSFVDDWKHLINWAEFTLNDGATDARVAESRARLPLHLVSIEMLRQLAAQMYQPADQRPSSFLETFPIGWYRVEFDTQVDASGDIEHVERLVLVYDAEHKGFEKLQSLLGKKNLGLFIDPLATLDALRAQVEPWVTACFPDRTTHIGGDLVSDVFHIARHMAQSTGDRPQFFPIEERSKHDLDALAQDVFDRNVGRKDLPGIVQAEFDRKDRFWRVLYGSVDNFRDQFELVSRRIENEAIRGGQPPARPSGPTFVNPEAYEEAEAPEEMKRAVKERDGWKCLCCGAEDKKYLEVDHIVARSHGGRHELANLQTLCRRCNKDKGINEQNFLRQDTTMVAAHPDFAIKMEPVPTDAGDRVKWERCVRATLNHYFRCAATSRVEIGARGERFYEWRIILNPGNSPKFLEPHLGNFRKTVFSKRLLAGYEGPNAIVVEGTDATGKAWSTRAAVNEDVTTRARM